MTQERKMYIRRKIWQVITYSTELGVAFLFIISGLLPVYGVIALACFLSIVAIEKFTRSDGATK